MATGIGCAAFVPFVLERVTGEIRVAVKLNSQPRRPPFRWNEFTVYSLKAMQVKPAAATVGLFDDFHSV
ncbi:MAG: hypothetical protein QGG36_03985, partial [Pirellulaceae bacterium]|nr:hypothetical protein [Pirellulaceae bacterium]